MLKVLKVLAVISVVFIITVLSTSSTGYSASNSVTANSTASSSYVTDTGSSSVFRITLRCTSSATNSANLTQHWFECRNGSTIIGHGLDITPPISSYLTYSTSFNVYVPYGTCQTIVASQSGGAFWSSGSPLSSGDGDQDSVTVCGFAP